MHLRECCRTLRRPQEFAQHAHTLQGDRTHEFVRFADRPRTAQTEIVMGSRVVPRATGCRTVV